MWQFSLRSLLLAMLAICVLTWMFFVIPAWVYGMMLVVAHFLVPGATIAGILYLPGRHRAFFIGVAPAAVLCFLLSAIIFIDDGFRDLFRLVNDDGFEGRVVMSTPLGVMFISGWIAVGMYLWGLRLKQATATRQEQTPLAVTSAGERHSVSANTLL